MKAFLLAFAVGAALQAQGIMNPFKAKPDLNPGPVAIDFGDSPSGLARPTWGKEGARLKACRQAQWGKAEDWYREHLLPVFQKWEAYERSWLEKASGATTPGERFRQMAEDASSAEANGESLQSFLRDYLRRIWRLDTAQEDPAYINCPNEASKRAFQDLRQSLLALVATLDRMDVEEGRAMKGLPPTKKPSTK